MDITERKITKIAREVEKLVLRTLREQDIGIAEIDLIHALRHNPGCTQAALEGLLHADKAATARRAKKKATLSAGTPPMTAATSCCIPRKRRRT